MRKFRQGAAAGEVNVPCAGCTACCRDPKLVVQLTPAEAERLRHVDDPEMGAVIDRNADGACAYFIDGGCSIYRDRPALCRLFDCRMDALTGIAAGGEEYAAAVSRWRFSYPTREDRVHQIAIRMAAFAAIKAGKGYHDVLIASTEWRASLDPARRVALEGA